MGEKVTTLYRPRDPTDFRIDTFDRLWFSALVVTAFACLWLLFGAVSWALSHSADLAVLGERAFAVIAGMATVIGIAVLWNAAELYLYDPSNPICARIVSFIDLWLLRPPPSPSPCSSVAQPGCHTECGAVLRLGAQPKDMPSDVIRRTTRPIARARNQ